MKRIICILLCVGLSGCITYSLEELRQVEPTGDAFQKALFKHYKYFAQKEEQQYDWFDAMYFADKGLQAAYGKSPSPEELGQWDIEPDMLPLLQTALHSLMEVLASDTKTKMPEVAARAQYYFDCWVEEQEEGWQTDDISYCREGFTDTMDLLLGKPVKKKVKKEEKKEEKPEKPFVSRIPKKPQSYSYHVFFKGQDKEISAQGKQIITKAIEIAKENSAAQIELNAYTDTVGDVEDNQKLSQERAQKVREMLVVGGIDADRIRLFAFGESDTPVKTADNIPEPANQRVEIFISQ